MFGRATITLGIGPHSSCFYFFVFNAGDLYYLGYKNFRIFLIIKNYNNKSRMRIVSE